MSSEQAGMDDEDAVVEIDVEKAQHYAAVIRRILASRMAPGIGAVDQAVLRDLAQELDPVIQVVTAPVTAVKIMHTTNGDGSHPHHDFAAGSEVKSGVGILPTIALTPTQSCLCQCPGAPQLTCMLVWGHEGHHQCGSVKW